MTFGPIIEFESGYTDDMYQSLQDNGIRYTPIAALSYNVTEMVELLHAVNTPETWAAIVLIVKKWINRHKDASVELTMNENGQLTSVKINGYNVNDLDKPGVPSLIRASFKSEE